MKVGTTVHATHDAYWTARGDGEAMSRNRSHHFINMAGQSIGYLVVTERYEIRGRRAWWLCHCQCGRETWVNGKKLRGGTTQSCGCKGAEYEVRENRKIYNLYLAMMSRCYSPDTGAYKNYGARGIHVCQRWRNSFAAFMRDMGPRPTGTTIDRIDNDGPYSPENCRWATHVQQARNRRCSVTLTIDGETLPLIEWSRRTGVQYGTIRRRLENGWPVEESILQIGERNPIRGRHNGCKTHCKNGHEFTAANTRIYKGQRQCRACGRERRRQFLRAGTSSGRPGGAGSGSR